MKKMQNPKPRHSLNKHHIMTGCILASCVVLFLLLSKGLSLDPSGANNELLQTQALPFNLKLLKKGNLKWKSETITLEDLVGKPIVLNFWASWCSSCREEATQLEKFWQANKNSLVVVGIAVQDQEEFAMEFIKQYGKTYVLGLDLLGNSTVNYGVTGVPETFFIDRQGVIRHKITGPVDFAQLEAHKSLIL